MLQFQFLLSNSVCVTLRLVGIVCDLHTCFVTIMASVPIQMVCVHPCAGQEREQTSGRASEVVDTKERVVEVTQPDPCGGVPTGAGGVGAATGRTSTTGAGYGTGSGSSGAGGAGYKGAQYDQSGGQVDDRSMMQKVGDAVKPGSQVGQHAPTK